MEKTKKERFRRIRGYILYYLVKEYPAYLDHHEIRCLLDDLRYTITEDELKFYLAYLRERGFIRSEILKSENKEREIEFSTADGILVNDGKIKDPAIDVESLP